MFREHPPNRQTIQSEISFLNIDQETLIKDTPKYISHASILPRVNY